MALKQHYQDEVRIIVADLDNPNTEALLEEFPVLYIPAFFFIDTNGEIVTSEAGTLDFEDMVARIEPLIVKVSDEGEVGGDMPDNSELSGLEYFFSVVIPDIVEERSFLAVILIFAGGVVTSISPCILSMVPLLVSYISGYGEGTRSRGFSLSLFFVVGMAITFAILGFIAASLGSVFGQIGEVWYYILAAVAIIMGLQLLGVLTLDLPGFKKIPLKKAGLGGSLIMGLLFGLVASPCATPVLAVIITYAAMQGEPLYGSGLLFIYGLGHGIPLLLAGTFTGLARNLPKINRYTQYLSYASGVILIVLGLVLLIWVNR
ncbi:MAG: cytochrome c biogenesis protein CcdA [Bacillota bacterium]|nr:cytochrome c biogenesis protein CcdA [Bacillota bacterium]